MGQNKIHEVVSINYENLIQFNFNILLKETYVCQQETFNGAG